MTQQKQFVKNKPNKQNSANKNWSSKQQPNKQPQTQQEPAVRHYNVTDEFKQFFISYCNEKLEQTKKRLHDLFEEIVTTHGVFQNQSTFFKSFSEKDFLEHFGKEEPLDGAEKFVDACNKMTSKIQSYASTSIEYYGIFNIMKEIEEVQNTKELYDKYNIANQEKTFPEKILGMQRRYFTKACNYANGMVLTNARQNKE